MTVDKSMTEDFVAKLIADKKFVSVFLLNGIKLTGIITEEDKTCFILKNTMPQMVYKHAVSTIVPSQ